MKLEELTKILKENTNVFCYYILKLILLYNNNEFLVWCQKNNSNIITFDKTSGNLDKLSNFFKKKYKSKKLLKDIYQMENIYNKLRRSLKKNPLLLTSRQTICESN